MFTFGPASRSPVAPLGGAVLLCHFDGTNGDTTTTDEYGNTITLSGFNISSAQARFGATSLRNITASSTVAGAQITPAPSLNIANQDFTIELFARATVSSTQVFFQFNNTGDTAKNIAMALVSSSSIQASVGDLGSVTATMAGLFPINTWHHVALCREGNTCRIFVNGFNRSTSGEDITGTAVASSFNNLAIGGNGSWSPVNAWRHHIDEFRVTVGVALYTANFTPPTAAFPPP